MAAEDQVVAAALAGQPSSHVEPLGGQGVLPRLEAILAQPVVHVLARQTLAARRTVDVAECEREIDYLLAVDQLDHIIWAHVPVLSCGIATNSRLDLSAPMLHLNGPPMAGKRAAVTGRRRLCERC